MFRVGDLVAVKTYYKNNTWQDVFKITKVNFNNKTIDLYYYATDRGSIIIDRLTSSTTEPFGKFVIIPELNKNRSTHLPKWW